MKRLLVFLPLLLLACAPKPEAEAPQTTAPLRVQVRTLKAEPGLLPREARASANVVAEKESLVAAGASGRVVRTLPAGTRVRAGEGVVFLDPAPFQEALAQAKLALRQAEENLARAEAQTEGNRKALEAQLAAAEAQLAAAKRRYEEGKALLALGALAPLELKGLEAQYLQAQSAYENAKEALARLEREDDLRLLRLQVEAARLQVQQAERNLKESVVRAPFAGEVVEVYVKEGEFAGAGSRAFRLATTDRLLVKVYLPPERAAALTEDTAFRVRQNGKEVEARLQVPPLPKEKEVALFRVVQEALTNVLRHARAGRVKVELWPEGDRLFGLVEDDGVGFDPESTPPSVGLLGMQERIQRSLAGEKLPGYYPLGGAPVPVW